MMIKYSHCYILFALLALVTITLSEEVEESDSYWNMNEPEELINPHSFHYDRVNKKMLMKENAEMSNEASTTDNTETGVSIEVSSSPPTEEKQSLPASNTCKEERIFYARLIKLLLANLNIKKENKNPTTATVTLEITDDQMKILNNIKPDQISFREIDAIMAEIIKKPSFNFMSEAIRATNKLIDVTELLFRKLSEHMQAIIICVIVALTLIMIRRRSPMAHGLPICIIAQVVFLVSFLITWWQLTQEAEIKLRAAQMAYTDIPIACQPDKMNMWHKFVATVFPSNDCEKYYEAMMSDAKLKVTPAMAISHLVSSVIVHPVSNIGHAISEFIDKSTDRLPWTYGWLVRVGLFLCIGLVILVLPFVMFGASFNVGLGPLFRFGIDCKKEKVKSDKTEQKLLREPVQIILQMAHTQSAPSISTITESGEVKALTCVTNTELTKIDTEKKEDCKKPDFLIQEKSSRESSVENETTSHATACDHCKKSSPKIEVGGGDN